MQQLRCDNAKEAVLLQRGMKAAYLICWCVTCPSRETSMAATLPLWLVCQGCMPLWLISMSSYGIYSHTKQVLQLP